MYLWAETICIKHIAILNLINSVNTTINLFFTLINISHKFYHFDYINFLSKKLWYENNYAHMESYKDPWLMD